MLGGGGGGYVCVCVCVCAGLAAAISGPRAEFTPHLWPLLILHGCSESRLRWGLQVWQLPALVEVRTLRGHKRGVWAVQFSPTQRALITSSGDRTLKMWSLQDGSCQRTFEGHLASVLQVSFLSAGQQVCLCHSKWDKWGGGGGDVTQTERHLASVPLVSFLSAGQQVWCSRAVMCSFGIKTLRRLP